MSSSSTTSSSTTTTTSRASNGGGGGGSGTQACAACKYQRRKCTSDCILAPYFPAENLRQFLNAHRLFGVSNILKIIRSMDPSQRSVAMSSIKYQADARARDPVGGCYAAIVNLWRQIHREAAELDAVLRYLAVYREQYARAAQAQGLPPPPPLPPMISTHPNFLADPVLQHLHLPPTPASAPLVVAAPPPPPPPPQAANFMVSSNNFNNHNHHHHHHHHHQMMLQQEQQQHEQLMSIPNASCYPPYPPQELDHLEANNINANNNFSHCDSSFPGDVVDHHQLMMPTNNNNNNSSNDNDEESSFMDNSSRTATNFDNEYDDDVKPHLLGILDANPQLLGNIPNDSFPCSRSSNRSPVGESSGNMEDVKEHDLKGAASLFTLQNCNNSGV